jgi:ribonuclease R
MLPEALSNDLCSLRPDEDRLAFSAIFTMTRDGVVHERWFGETLMRSIRRFSYQDAQKVLTEGHGDLYDELKVADTVARALRKQRFDHGSIGFETDEVKFVLDAEGRPVRAFRKERLDTMLMIEDLMLLANREVATWMHEKTKNDPSHQVFVWRVHDAPKPERIIELGLLVEALGYTLEHNKGFVTAQAINALFDEVDGTAEQDLIETAAIRSMAKAVYSLKNLGHFGLAFPFYTHFTSPIRRYPDLMVHRILKSHLQGKPVGTREAAYYERLARQSSEREVAAQEAERDSIKLKQVEYMQGHIGEEFNGVVTGINDWGMFVAEHETMAEGLVRTSSLRDDFYVLAEHGYRLAGQRTGRTISLGQKVRMRLKGVDVEKKMIDWELLPDAQT